MRIIIFPILTELLKEVIVINLLIHISTFNPVLLAVHKWSCAF
jgi:hypothetical protein